MHSSIIRDGVVRSTDGILQSMCKPKCGVTEDLNETLYHYYVDFCSWESDELLTGYPAAGAAWLEIRPLGPIYSDFTVSHS